MIEISHLQKSFKKSGIRNVQIEVLKDVSLTIENNKIFSIVGPNGAGKSTTLKILMGFLHPTMGTACVDKGVKIGYLPENPYYYDYLTLKELLWFSCRTFGMESTVTRIAIRQAAELVGLGNHLNKKLRTFSKGMTQRAGLAAAIVHNPDLVVLDEPMSGLDPHGREMVFELILDMKRNGKTVLFCSHILSDVERLCDEIVIMHQGEIRRRLTRDELLLSQKGTEIVVANQGGADLFLKEREFSVQYFDDHISIYAEGPDVNAVLQMISEHGIKVLNIKSSEVTLERIFHEVTV